ncbi:dTDP-4-dehydrorhamnose reductase [Gilliamella apicola SCGC AB-598-I20]|nr:dTDP-4-dehydrorhamnose reductase [Gilliamella apicola SCGC AB-598-I20]
MKVLLTGTQGQLGHCFRDIFPSNWKLIALNHLQFDITDYSVVDRLLTIYKPEIIVNTAAYTAVDNAEIEQELAYNVNVLGSKNIAIASNKHNVRLFHISTDYVFDGNKKTPYLETDFTNPINIYGKTKRDGELVILENDPSAIIIRTSWLFSEYNNNFVKTMLKLAIEKNEITIVDDQLGNPTYAGDLAKAILDLFKKEIDGGIYHYCGNVSTTWYLFAKEIFDIALKQGLLSHIPKISPIHSKDYNTKASRPLFSVLSTKKLGKYGIKNSDWQKKLETCISKIKLI